MFKILPANLSAYIVLLFAAFHLPLQAASIPCPPASTLLAANDPAYSDAMGLARSLENHGFVVQCMFPTKLGSIFMVAGNDGIPHSTIEGEACFHTNYGDFDVFFMAKPQTFADFTITERREGSGYMYKFAGTPQVWATNRFGTAYRQHFLKHDNQLVLVMGDQLRVRLEEAFRPGPSV